MIAGTDVANPLAQSTKIRCSHARFICNAPIRSVTFSLANTHNYVKPTISDELQSLACIFSPSASRTLIAEFGHGAKWATHLMISMVSHPSSGFSAAVLKFRMGRNEPNQKPSPCLRFQHLARESARNAGTLDPLEKTRAAEPYTTTIGAPTGTRSYRSMTSWLIMRTQPDETEVPIDHHSGEPWTR